MALVRRVRGRRRERTSWASNRDLLSIKFLPFNHKCGCECDSEIVNICTHCHWVKSWRRELWVTTCDKESWKEIGRVMVEKDAEGEEDALVNSSTGFKERSRGFGSQKDGDSTSCRSGCCASLGTICCRGHRRKDNKGKYAACQWFEFDKRCVKMCSHDFSQETSSGCVTQKPSWFEVKSVEQGGGVAYTGTVVQKSVQREPQAAVGSQLPELCKTGAGSRAHCLWTTVDPGFPGNHLLALGSQFWPSAAFQTAAACAAPGVIGGGQWVGNVTLSWSLRKLVSRSWPFRPDVMQSLVLRINTTTWLVGNLVRPWHPE